jgi:CYTH domain-containing protein
MELSDTYEVLQGFISKNDKGSIRIRIETYLGHLPKAYLISKTNIDNVSSNETVNEISLDNALIMINRYSLTLVEKTRFIRYLNGNKWVIDLFKKPNLGLILAEIELESKDQNFDLPNWVIKEVTNDKSYSNMNMQ